jgi:hypothetical protein
VYSFVSLTGCTSSPGLHQPPARLLFKDRSARDNPAKGVGLAVMTNGMNSGLMAEITRAFRDPGRYVIEAELLAEGARLLALAAIARIRAPGDLQPIAPCA